jgi:uncharacterized protein with PIN domain
VNWIRSFLKRRKSNAQNYATDLCPECNHPVRGHRMVGCMVQVPVTDSNDIWSGYCGCEIFYAPTSD